MSKYSWAVSVALFGLFVLSGCGGKGAAVTNDPVTLSPVNASLYVLELPFNPPGCSGCGCQSGCSFEQFEAVVQGAPNTQVNWLVNGMPGGDATVGTISTTGLYLPPNEVPPGGSVTVTAQNGGQSASATVNLTYPSVAFFNPGLPSPDKVQLTAAPVKVVVSGGPFSQHATGYLNGNPIPATFISTSQLALTLPAGSCARQSTLLLGAKNPAPGGGGPDGTSTSNGSIPFYAVEGKFVTVGNINTARSFHTATLLPNGKVLIAGGNDSSGNPLSSAELFDPATNQFQNIGNMTAARVYHAAVLLPNGQVLIAGGDNNNPTSSEVYDPVTNTFTAITAQMNYNHARVGANGFVLSNGKALIQSENENVNQFYELDGDVYDPATNTYAAAAASGIGYAGNIFFPCVGQGWLLSSGTNLEWAGVPADFDPQTLIYYNANGASNVGEAIGHCSVTLLNDGSILEAGGTAPFLTVGPNQVWQPTTGNLLFTFQLQSARDGHAAVLLQSGEVLLAGAGYFDAEVFDESRKQSFVGPDMNIHRGPGLTGTLLPDGRVLVVGAAGNPSSSPVSEVYVP